MSLETLLEAARFVEQQELRAKQIHLQQQTTQQQQQQQQQHPQQHTHQITRSPPFKIVSSVVAPLTITHTHIAQTPPTALVAVPQVPTLVHQGHSLVAGASLQPNHAITTPRPPGAVHQVQNTSVMLSTQPGVVEVIKPSSIVQNFENKTLIIEEGVVAHQTDLKKRNNSVTVTVAQPPPPTSTTTGMMRSGTREVHNKLEKNRRAHLKECFELLKKQLPQQQDEKKTSNLSILHSALRYIQGLRKKERENEHEMERLARDKIASQQRLAALKKELGPQWDNIDLTLIQAPEPPLLAITNNTNTNQTMTMTLAPPQNPIKEELYDSDEPITRVTTNILTNTTTHTTVISSSTNQQISVPTMLPLPQVGYPVSQGLVLGVQKVALVSSKNLPLVSSPIAHIIPQLNGKVVPLVNAQYLMKPVVVVSTPNQGNTNITPRPS